MMQVCSELMCCFPAFYFIYMLTRTILQAGLRSFYDWHMRYA